MQLVFCSFHKLSHRLDSRKPFRDCFIRLLFDHKGTKSQRLEGKNFATLCLGDFVVKLLNALFGWNSKSVETDFHALKQDFSPPNASEKKSKIRKLFLHEF